MTQQQDRWGLPLGIGAYLLWGGMPLFFPLLEPAGPLEIVAHRIVWSLLFCLIALAALRQFGDFRTALRSPRILGTFAVAAALIVVNWVVYVYAVLSDRVLDAALGATSSTPSSRCCSACWCCASGCAPCSGSRSRAAPRPSSCCPPGWVGCPGSR